MNNNTFEKFLSKILNTPLWIRQLLSYRLSEQIRKENLSELSDFSAYKPTLTFEGQTELADRKCGFDSNIYNFLQCCLDNYCILEIAVNLFLSMEETAKFYEFCVEQNFITPSNSKEIDAMAGFISGKLRTGEYFEKKGLITENQLQQAIAENKDGEKFGQTLLNLGFIDKNQLSGAFKLKEENKKLQKKLKQLLEMVRFNDKD